MCHTTVHMRLRVRAHMCARACMRARAACVRAGVWVVRVCACVGACAQVCVCVCVGGGGCVRALVRARVRVCAWG